jgi:hypothetical protein
MGNETEVHFEKSRSAMWVGADIRRPTRPKQLIGAKKVMFWVCFTPIRIVDIVMLPPGETFDQSFFVDIVLDNLKKEFAQIPDPNPEKGHVLHLDDARPHVADHETKANNLTQLSHPAYNSDLTPADFWLFGYLKVMLEGSSFETAEKLQEKMKDVLM